MQSGFLNRQAPKTDLHKNGQRPADEVTLGRRADRAAIKPRSDAGQPSARFSIGDTCEVVGGAVMRATEDLNSDKVGQLLDGFQVEVVEIGSGPTGKRIAVKNDQNVTGWVSVVAGTGEALFRIVQKGHKQASPMVATSKAARADHGKLTSRYEVGDQCEVIGGALMRLTEDLDSAKVGQLAHGDRVEVVEIGCGPSGKRLAVKDEQNERGWVSVIAGSGESLLRIVQKGQKQVTGESSKKPTRADQGKPTSRYEIGDLCDVMGGAIVRETEELDSAQLRRLPDRSEVKVIEIGTGWSGKRIRIQDSNDRTGWVSVVSADGTQLLRPVKPPAPEPPPARLPEPSLVPQRIPIPETEPESTSMKVPLQRPEPPPTLLTSPGAVTGPGATGQELAKWNEPFVLVSASRAQKGFDLEVPWLERDNVDQLLAEKWISQGVLEPSYDYVKLRDAKGKWYRPGEAPENPTPELFPITLYYRPPKPEQTAETALALRQKQALDALTPTQRRSLAEVQRLLTQAYSNEDGYLLERAMRLAHESRLPMDGGQGLPISLMPDAVMFPAGNEPLLYDGQVYSMHSESMLVFDPPDFQTPMGVWNPRCQRVDPAMLKPPGSEDSEIVHFGKTYKLLEMGHVVDPDTEQVVGMVDSMSQQFEFFDPIPLAVAEFMTKRGFRMEAPSAALTNGPFVQILPEDETQQSNPELHMQMQSMGSNKALRYAPVEQRSNKDLVISMMKAGGGVQNWKVMLYGTEEVRCDRDVVLEAVKQDYMAMSYASAFYDDKDFMLKAVQAQGSAFQYGAEAIRADPDLAYAAVKTSWVAIKHVAEKLRGSSKIIREAVRQCWQALEYASEDLKDDKDIVSLAVKQSWRALQWAGPRLQADKQVLLNAVTQSVDAMQYAAEQLCADQEFMQQAVRLHGLAIKFAVGALVDDRDLVLEAVRQDWRALQYASELLRGDRAVVLEAVRQHQDALSFATEQAREDKELIFEAARRRPDFLRVCPDSVRGDLDFMMRFVKFQPMALQFATDELRGNEELALEALRRNWRSLQHASRDLRACRAFMMKAVQMDALTLSFADEELQSDPEIVCEAVEREWEMLAHVSEELRSNPAFMMEAVSFEGLCLKYAPESLRCDRELVLVALQNCGQALEFAAEELQADPEIVLMAVRQDFEAITYASPELTSNFLFMFRAVGIHGEALKGASLELRADPELVLAAVAQSWRALKHASRALTSSRDFMIRAIRIDPYALSMARDKLFMDPKLLAAAAEAQNRETFATPSDSSSRRDNVVSDSELRSVLKSARPNWNESELESAEQKLAVIGVVNLASLDQALAGNLNGQLRAAGQKIFTATTIMELKARTAAAMSAAASAAEDAARAICVAAKQPTSKARPRKPNARLTY
eukprot:TRINITY_DN72206_c0_g1_i1.p1 TRINITY_DN72206_c0_g1~~TRINITY_DN72206_c0_g1_i1.p1  ORF type:complete len:1390 (+),score=277.57 TRINITY_DN72206_c0_g1_i1:200-4369(+)